MFRLPRLIFASCLALTATIGAVAQQTKSFIPVEGANLKAKIDNAMMQGKASSTAGVFWVGYQFEVRPGVAIDFDIVSPDGTISISNDGWSIMSDSRYETRELGMFFLYEKARDTFTRAEVYNLRRDHQFSSYPVYWAGKATNEESLSYLKSIVDSNLPEVSRLSDRAAFAIALHDDARVEGILTELVKRPAPESIRNRAIYWLGFTPESESKNALLAGIVRTQTESSEARSQAMSALGMSRAAATLPLLENLYETMTSRDLKRRALAGIARNDNRDAATTYLIQVAQTAPDVQARTSDFDLQKSAISGLGRIQGDKSLNFLTRTLESSSSVELQKQAVVAIGRRPKDEAIPILMRAARNHPNVEVKKLAVQMLGRTQDERAAAFLNELLTK
ncbi:MAG TPA: HEAT repeat domain-containing protein [Pyrinomonadaceae bacterium]|nr:HEAT repeat domain-containing protein [Pyrinomonadaceae bacterium]